MDLKELFKDVTSFNKEAAMKENMRMVELKDSVTANAFRDAQIKLASYVNVIKIDSPESNLTEFSRNKLSGKMKAMLSVSTTAGLKRLPIHFVVKASVPSLVETPEQVVAALDNVEGSIDKEVKEILEKQKQMSAYHNEDIEVKADGEKIPAVQYRDMHTAIHHLALFNTRDEALEAFERLKQIQHTEYPEGQEGEEGYTMDMYEAFATSTGDIEVDYRTVQDDPKYDIVNKDFVIDASSKKSNITVQAKKKEIDLGVRENSSASQFPVKLLVYPKTYLPELKKGDILNVGGFKYRYIGDEPTISGDTENGINARFELVVNTKKASLQVQADKLPETTSEDIANSTREAVEMRKYLDSLSKEDLSDKTESEIQLDILNLLDYGKDIPHNYYKALSDNRQLALWFLSLDETPITDLEGDVPANIFKHIQNDAKAAYKVLIDHPTDTFTSFDKLPEFFQNVFMTDVSVMLKIAKEHPEWVSDKMADAIISDSPSEAIELGVSNESKTVKNPAFEKFKNYAAEHGVTPDNPTNEELGLEDGPAEGESISEDDMDFTGAEDEENEYHKQQKDYGADLSGTGLENVVKEKQQESEDEANQNQDILDDEEHEKKDTKKKSKNDPVLEKEADVTEGFTFTADAKNTEVDTDLISTKELYAKLKEKYSQLSNIPDEWIEIVDTKWYGSIKWAIDIDAREWGLKTFSPVAYASKLSCTYTLSYFENAEEADKGDPVEEDFELEFDLQDIDCQFDGAFESGSDFGVTTIEIVDFDSATLHF